MPVAHLKNIYAERAARRINYPEIPDSSPRGRAGSV